MSDLKQRILTAARAESIPEGESGLWRIRKVRLAKAITVPRDGKPVRLDAGCYTKLLRYTMSNPFDMGNSCGEVVMEDTIYELRTHLEFMLRAHGSVLVTGLGLGCVVRGLLANPAVRSVVVVERDADVFNLVAMHMPAPPNLVLIHAEAKAWVKKHARQGMFDCAWHDVWTDTDAGEPHLAVRHQELIHETLDKVKFQGAWAFPRMFRRTYREQNVL